MVSSVRIFAACLSLALAPAAMATVTVKLTTSIGNLTLDLYDEAKPNTVKNFLKYIRDGHYVNSFAHRLPPGFVLQGGSYYVSGNQIYNVATFDPIVDEAGPFPEYSNVKGTIAMALSGTGNDTATSGWFINLGNNDGTGTYSNLDTLNGGFTVFGKVTSGMNLVDRFAAFQQTNSDGVDRIFNTDPGNPNNPLATLPLKLVVNGQALFENLIFTTWEITGGTKPVITSPATVYGQKGVPFSYQIAATGDPSSFAVTGGTLPTGVTVNTTSGLISGTPTSSTPGTLQITVSATGTSGTGSADFTIGYNYPIIPDGLTAHAITDTPFQFQIPATNNPTYYEAVGLPTGVTLNPTTGLISGAPTVYGEGYVTLYASNAGGTYMSRLYLTIQLAAARVAVKKSVSATGIVTLRGTSNNSVEKIEVLPGRGGFQKTKGAAQKWSFRSKRLKPGTYRFKIRATTSDGTKSITPVTVVVKGKK